MATRARLVRATTLLLLGTVVVLGWLLLAPWIGDRKETLRTTSRFDPPVWAGQDVPGACSGGF